MTFNTRDITLAEITAGEFYQRKEYWGNTRLQLHYQSLPAAIENPVIMPLISDNPVTDYKALLQMLLEHPYAFKVCIRQGSVWIKRYKDQLDDTEVALLAAFASTAPDKINYLEIKYKDPNIDYRVRARPPWQNPVIRFAETKFDGGNAIVGYQIHLPIEYLGWFTTSLASEPSDFTLVHGFWLPSSVRLQS